MNDKSVKGIPHHWLLAGQEQHQNETHASPHKQSGQPFKKSSISFSHVRCEK